jgi:hypothetical protein
LLAERHGPCGCCGDINLLINDLLIIVAGSPLTMAAWPAPASAPRRPSLHHISEN